MKLLLIVALISTLSFAQTKTKKLSSGIVSKTHVKKLEKHPVIKDKKEADCDVKAKKPVEIIPESMSLSGGNAGCTLE